MAIATLLGALATENDWTYLVSSYDVVDSTSIFQYMPLDATDKGKFWKVATNSRTRNEKAPIIAPGASLPEGEKGVIEYMRGELPKLGKKYSMNDNELMEYQEAMRRATSVTALQELVAETMNRFIQKSIKSVQNTLNWIGYQSMSRGIIRLTEGNNGAVVSDEDVDYQMDRRGRYGDAWTDKVNAKPITVDLRGAVREGRALGRRYRFAWMNLATFSLFAATDEVIKMTASLATNILGAAFTPTLEQVNNALRGRADLYGLQIKIVDELLDEEDGTTENPFIDGVVLFTETERLGETHWTTPPDMQAESAGAYRTMNSFICLKKWAEEDPLVDWTAGVAYAFPVFSASQRSMLLDVLNSDWDEGGKIE